MKSAVIAEGMQEQLERFALDDPFAGHVIDHEMREVRLAGHRAKAGELRDLHVDPVVALRRRIDEGF